MSLPIFTRSDISKLSRLIKSRATYPNALALAKKIHSRADNEAINNSADDVFVIERLINELDTQINNPAAIDIEPLADCISDAYAILDEITLSDQCRRITKIIPALIQALSTLENDPEDEAAYDVMREVKALADAMDAAHEAGSDDYGNDVLDAHEAVANAIRAAKQP